MFSRKYVKTLQEKNERLFEDLENAQSVSARRGMEILSLKDSLEVEQEKVKYLTGVIKGLNEEARKASEESVAMCSDLRLVESAYNDLDGLLQKSNKSLEACGERLWELEEEISHLREELHDAMMEIERLKKESENDSTYEYSKDKIRFSATFNGKTFSAPYSDTVANHIDNVMNLYWEGYRKVVDTLQQLSDSMEGQDTTAGFKNSISVSVFSSSLGYSVPITLSINKRAEWSLI